VGPWISVVSTDAPGEPSVHVELSESISVATGHFLQWWESVLVLPASPTRSFASLEECCHYHRSEKTAERCGQRRLRAAVREHKDGV
jgi:hypothetical protein